MLNCQFTVLICSFQTSTVNSILLQRLLYGVKFSIKKTQNMSWEQQIRKDVQKLDSLLNHGNKEKNVKLELKEFAQIKDATSIDVASFIIAV